MDTKENETKKNNRPEPGRILTSAVFALILWGVFFLNLFMPKAEVLQSERRKPAEWPKLSADTLLSSEFMDKFAKYASDNFMFRDQLRTVRAFFVFGVFLQTDKSGLYNDAAAGAGKFEKIDENSVQKAAEKIKKLCAFFPALDIYYSFVPDKSVYASMYYPGFEPEKAKSILEGQLSELTFIDLTDTLSAGDFYRTDLHWDQSKIAKTAERLALAMGFSDRLETKFEQNPAGSFHGVYTGQLALPQPPDEMTYLTNDILNGAKVSYFNPVTDFWEQGPMYDIEAAGGRDPYDLFLKGVQALVVIENPSAKTDRQLYLFRDSFGSSLAPLLVSAYAKITVIDIRYIDSRVLEQYVGMPSADQESGGGGFVREGADVLFLYSSQILNNSNILLVN
ncbi:MAG: DHHW family protein [Oscillospiraceae bacterium]|nr:DHHW family protein [Oscillospiraceae bacterium]